MENFSNEFYNILKSKVSIFRQMRNSFCTIIQNKGMFDIKAVDIQRFQSC